LDQCLARAAYTCRSWGLLPERSTEVAQQISSQQREDDLAVQESRAQDERLREYIDKLGTLLVKGDLDTKGYGEKVSDVARARTLTLL
jgi:hypothetical protein